LHIDLALGTLARSSPLNQAGADADADAGCGVYSYLLGKTEQDSLDQFVFKFKTQLHLKHPASGSVFASLFLEPEPTHTGDAGGGRYTEFFDDDECLCDD